jgi:hypothetical protein
MREFMQSIRRGFVPVTWVKERNKASTTLGLDIIRSPRLQLFTDLDVASLAHMHLAGGIFSWLPTTRAAAEGVSRMEKEGARVAKERHFQLWSPKESGWWLTYSRAVRHHFDA